MSAFDEDLTFENIDYTTDSTLDYTDLARLQNRLIERYSREAIDVWRSISCLTINSDPLKRAVDACYRVMSLADGHVDSQGLKIIGDVGTGKTTVIKSLINQFQPKNIFNNPTGNYLIYTRLDFKSTRLGIIRQILENFRHPLTSMNIRPTTADIKLRIACNAMKNAKTKALVVDEAQNLYTSRRGRQIKSEAESDVSDMLRFIMDEIKIPVILIGTKALEDLSDLDRGLGSRIRSTVRMPLIDHNLLKDVLPAYIDKIRPFCKVDLLGERDVFNQVLDFTKGQQRHLKRLMAEIGLEVVQGGHNNLTLAVLKKAMVSLHDEVIK